MSKSLRNCDRDIYKDIYEKCYLRLFNLSYSILKNRVQAEEVMQDTLFKYFELTDEFNYIKDRDKWLTRVCVNKSIDQLRKNRSEKVVYTGSLSDLLELEAISYEKTPYPTHEEVNIEGITVKKIKKAIDLLAPGYRLIMVLIHYEGLDYEEVAQITGLKESTVRSQYTRAKKRLLEVLSKGEKKEIEFLCINHDYG